MESVQMGVFGNNNPKKPKTPGGGSKPQRTSGGTRGHGTGSGSGLRKPEHRSKSEIDAMFARREIDSAKAAQLYRINQIKGKPPEDSSGAAAMIEREGFDPKHPNRR